MPTLRRHGEDTVDDQKITLPWKLLDLVFWGLSILVVLGLLWAEYGALCYAISYFVGPLC